MEYDAIIFDIDGTLWDVRKPIAEGWNNALAKAGRSERVNAQEIGSVLGNPTDVCIDRLLPGAKKSVPGLKAIIEKNELAVIGARGGEFFEGVCEGVKELAKSYKIFIVSNCDIPY